MPILRLHASGAVETFQNSDAPGYYPAATIVGAPPQWDDANDATWGRSQTDGAGTGDWRAVVAQLDALPTTVTADKVVSITSHVRYDTAHPSGAQLREYVLAIHDPAHIATTDSNAYGIFSSNAAYPHPPADNLIHEADFVIYPNTPPVNMTALLAAFWGGALLRFAAVVTGSGSSFLRSAVTVYEAWIDVEYVGGSVLRQWPRDDAYGANATPRQYPPPRAQRHIGGQP